MQIYQMVRTATVEELVEACWHVESCTGSSLPPAFGINTLWTLSVDRYADYTPEQRGRMRAAARQAEARLGEPSRDFLARSAEEAHNRADARLAGLDRATSATGKPYFETED